MRVSAVWQARVVPTLALGVVAAFTLGCGGRSQPTPDVIARIGPVDRRYQEFESYLQSNSLGTDAGLGSPVLSRLMDQWVSEELLAQRARDEGLVGERDTARDAVAAILGSDPGAVVSETEVEEWYITHSDEFRFDERVRMRQILLLDPEVADRVRGEWAAGVAFEELLARYSPHLEAFQGDDVDLTREDLPPALAEVIFALETGEVSRVQAADYGFHIFQVTQRAPASQVPFPEARADIRRRLEAKHADRSLRAYLERAHLLYDVEVFWRNLPFNYDGRYREGPAGVGDD